MKYLLFISLLLSVTSFSQTEQGSNNCKWTAPKSLPNRCNLFKEECSIPFKISTNCMVETYNLKIVNRQGTVIFETNDLEKYWNVAGVKKGTYFWIITGVYQNGDEFKKQGQIVIKKDVK